MKQSRLAKNSRYVWTSLGAVLAVVATTVPLFLIGRPVLGEAVIALVYLVPVTWSAYHWGRLPGISAALTAALAFDFLFTTPFYTFTIDLLEDWLILAIFLGVAIWVVDRIQTSLTRAREAVCMYELSGAVCTQRTPEAVAYALAKKIQELFQAQLVNVVFHLEKDSPATLASQPKDLTLDNRPDRVLPILNSWGLIGEIQIWRGLFMELPPEEGRLFQNFAMQAARAFERSYQAETERLLMATLQKAPSER